MSGVARVQHCASIDEVLALFEKDLSAEKLKSLFPNFDHIEYFWTKEGRLLPSMTAPFSSPFIYRGQTARFTPCFPGVFRGLGTADDFKQLSPERRARCFIDRVRLEEFVVALSLHPATAYAREIGLRIHPYALAQHYEITTDRIDLTQDHRVAAFFATNTRIAGKWLPVEEGTGVVYRIDFSACMNHFKERFEWIGKQALPRPGEQKGCTLSLPLGMDFESLPVEIYTFPHNGASGQRLNEFFSGGGALFPPDAMAEVADTIRQAPTIPRQLVDGLLKSKEPAARLLFDAHDGGAAFLEKNSEVKVAVRPLNVLSKSQLARANEAVEQMRKTFLQGTGALAVRGTKPGEHGREP